MESFQVFSFFFFFLLCWGLNPGVAYAKQALTIRAMPQSLFGFLFCFVFEMVLPLLRLVLSSP
jgi:hypothetical protein